ncbi:MAG: discoidin domain-containing protein [Clostridia bacterium]|nr:discoidin domain-containing protein [Clostridia bacterium]
MKNKIISVILSLVMIIGCMSSVANAENQYMLNEDFESYSDGGAPSASFSVSAPGGYAVKETETGSKVLIARSTLSSASISALFPETAMETVFSAQVLIGSDMTSGSLFTLADSSGQSFDIMRLSDKGALTLADGKRLGSFRSGEWKKIAVAVNFFEKRMDVYINGNAVLSSWRFNSLLTSASQLKFELDAPGGEKVSNLVVDNVKVYYGDKPEKADLQKRYLPLALCTDCISKDIAKDDTNSSSSDAKGTAYFYQDFTAKNIEMITAKENILEIARMPEGDEHLHAMHFKRLDNSNDFHSDFSLSNQKLWQESKYIIEFETYIVKNEGEFGLSIRNADSTRSTLVSVEGNNIKVNSSKLATIDYGTWAKIIVATDVTSQTCTVWVNGEKACTNLPVGNTRTTPRSMRFHVYAGSDTEMYVDNVRVYSGNIPFEVELYEGENGIATLMEPNSVAENYIDDAAVFMTECDSLYFGGKKYKYSDLGENVVIDNDEFMISEMLFEKVFPGTSKKISAHTRNISDINYVAVEKVCKDVLGYSVYSDERGFVMVDTNSLITYTNSNDTALEPIDEVYRYIQFDRESGKELLSQVESYVGAKGHPRILTNQTQLAKVKANANSDALVSKWLRDVLDTANAYVNSPIVEYKFEGGTLLNAARAAQVSIVNTSTAYLLTGDTKYAERAWLEMENVLSWQNWNQGGHHLDCSELLHGVAIGYDNLYSYLTDEQKKFVVDKTYELVLEGCVIHYSQEIPKHGWRKSVENWAVVCSGSLIAACIAFGTEGYSEYQEEFEFLLSSAMRTMEYPLMSFFPDGGWYEGSTYWNYTVKFLTQSVLAPLYYSTGSVHQMLDPKGVSTTLEYILYMQAGKGVSYNYFDSHASHLSTQDGFLIPTILGDEDLTNLWLKNCLDGSKTGTVTGLLWYTPTKSDTSFNLPNDKFFESTGTGHMIGEWGNTDNSFAAFRSGRNDVTHAHLDNGSFIFDALGERWAMDLGPDDYNIPGGYHNIDTGYQLYRKRPEGHNTVVINFREDIAFEYYGGQGVYCESNLMASESKPRGAYMAIDLSDIYKHDTKSYLRGYYLGDNRTSLIVQDEIELLENGSDINWFMHTEADVKIAEDGKNASLTIGSKEVRVEAVCNADSWYFTTTEPKPHETAPVRPGQLEGNYTNAGITRLTLKATGSGKVNITVKLTPVKNSNSSPVEFVPISQWTIPDGEIPEAITLTGISAYGEVIDGFEPTKYNYTIDIPYGEDDPVITATSDEGTVRVEQSSGDFEPARVYLADGQGNEYIYTVSINPVSRHIGIMDGMKVVYGTASASHIPQSENPPEHIVDGNLETRWAAQGSGPWCQTDLGKVTDIEGVALAIYDGENRIANFELYISEDGEKWQKIYDGTSSGKTNGYESYLINAKARYIRFVGFQSNVGSWNSVLELGALVK